MELSLIADSVTAAVSQGLGLAKFIHCTSSNHLSVCDSSSEQQSTGFLQISAAIFPVDAVPPPPVKSSHLKAARRTLVHKRRRTKRRYLTGGEPEDGEEGWFLGDIGCGGDGPFGGGNGGRGWNFDRFGWSDWDESSSASPADPAFDFVYEVICWIALSNCLHFAFKKVIRIMVDGMGDSERE